MSIGYPFLLYSIGLLFVQHQLFSFFICCSIKFVLAFDCSSLMYSTRLLVEHHIFSANVLYCFTGLNLYYALTIPLSCTPLVYSDALLYYLYLITCILVFYSNILLFCIMSGDLYFCTPLVYSNVLLYSYFFLCSTGLLQCSSVLFISDNLYSCIPCLLHCSSVLFMLITFIPVLQCSTPMLFYIIYI